MTLLEPPPELQSKPRAVLYASLGVLIVSVFVLYFAFRYFPEKETAEHFFDTVVAGDMNKAYGLWMNGKDLTKAPPSYTMKDFVADWGPNGYYGPIKSYKIVGASSPKDATGVILVVAVSPYAPMPDVNDPEKSGKTRFVDVWVDKNTKGFSFPP